MMQLILFAGVDVLLCAAIQAVPGSESSAPYREMFDITSHRMVAGFL